MHSDIDIQLYYSLLDRLAEVRDSHPSFQLTKIDKELFPAAHLNLEDCQVSDESRDSPQTARPLSEFFRESWGQKAQNHLMLEGEGGIGKTVALLSLSTHEDFLPRHVPAVYIPLHALKTKATDDSLQKYLLEETLHGDAQQYSQLYSLADSEWQDGPRLILLLDGFNEISPEYRYQIIRNIEEWSGRRGIQLIITSRFDARHSFPNLQGTLTALKLQPLSRQQIANHLEQAHISLPPPESPLWTVIDYPLMLALYAQTQALQRMDSAVPLEWREAQNAGTILWNYLQRELWRCQGQTRNRDTPINCVLATELTAPYLAWEMVRNRQFLVFEDEFSAWIAAICKRLEANQENWPEHVRQVVRRCGGIRNLPDADSVFYLLTSELNLFRIREGAAGPTVSLMHQRFRDCLAAIHLLNLAQALSEGDELPEAWKQSIDYYVMNFTAELLRPRDTAAEALWNANRRLRPPMQAASVNLLELYRRSRDFDFSGLDFSHMDLRKVHLNGYRSSRETHLRLPADGKKFHQAILSPETFAPEGHSDIISQIAVTLDGLRFVTASYDGMLRLWDMNTCRTIWVLAGHTSAVSDVALTADGHTCASASMDGSVRLWNMSTKRPIKRIPIFKTKQMRCVIKVQAADNVYFVFVTKEGVIRIWDVATDGGLQIWNASSGERVGGCPYVFTALTISADSSEIIGACQDHSLQIRSIASPRQFLKKIPLSGEALQITVMPNESQCMVTLDTGTQMLELHTGKVLGKFFPIPEQAVITPDGRRCICGIGALQIWNLETFTQMCGTEDGYFSISAIAITPDSSRCISASSDGLVRLWNLTSGRLIGFLETSPHDIEALTVTPDGCQCIGISKNGVIQTWNIETKALVSTRAFDDLWLRSAAITPDGNWCAGYPLFRRSKRLTSNQILLWNFSKWKRPHKLPFQDSYTAMALIENGNRLILAHNNENMGTVQIIDLKFGKKTPLCWKSKERQNYANDQVNAIAATPDGSCIILGTCSDIAIWHEGDNEAYLIPIGEWTYTVAVTPDGQRCVSASGDILQLWDTCTGECLSTIKLLHNIDLLGVDLSQAVCRPKDYAKTLYQNGALIAGVKPEDSDL